MRDAAALSSGDGGSTGLFLFGSEPSRDAIARLGAKGAALATLAAQAPELTAQGAVLEVELCAALAAAPEAEARARLDELFAGIGRAAPALARAPLALRLSPETAVADLSPALLGVGSEAAAAVDALTQSAAAYGKKPATPSEAALMLLAAWRGPRAQRRRMAAGARSGCALIVQPFAAGARLFHNVAQFDLETGAPLQDAQEDGAENAARICARRAEETLGAPLHCDVAVDEAGAAFVLTLRPFEGRAHAQVAAAVQMAQSGRIDEEAALLAVPAERITELLHARVADPGALPILARGLPASPGAATGRLAFDVDEAAAFAKAGEPAILARRETTPEDVHGMSAAAGVLTLRGGVTSHAAVVARGMGLPAVVGASDLRIETGDGAARLLRASGGRALQSGDWLTLDAAQGVVLDGQAEILQSEPTGAFKTLMGWADARRRMRVRVNADTPQEMESAARLGIDGVGLCRTEHMFFAPERITAMRRMIMADDQEERRRALALLLPMQRIDFERVFEIVLGSAGADAPATIRLLDPPLHEFLPREERGMAALADDLGAPVEKIRRRMKELEEDNPMLGKRGCRVGIAFPEIYEMQARAILQAAITVGARRSPTTNAPVRPRIEIMVPLVSAARELELIKGRIDGIADALEAEHGARANYCVGVMIETPRAALRADALAPLCSFFSIGTNDLTQMTYGLSRDDAGRLMRTYVERGVFEADPFASLDQDGVGELIEIGVARGRSANPDLAIGMCGEHGADPATIAFCEQAGFNYVSCSPYRTPIARLAAAQAAIRVGARAAQDDDGAA